MEKAIFWFRRDLRLEDNAGLYHALKSGKQVTPIFIFDTQILDKLDDKRDARVSFLHSTIKELKGQLTAMGSDLKVYYGDPLAIWKTIVREESVSSIYLNRDYEPYAKNRDAQVKALTSANNVSFHTAKDHVIFESHEVLKADGKPYTVFTPYKRRWLEHLKSLSIHDSYFLKSYPSEQYFSGFAKLPLSDMPSLESMGFGQSEIKVPPKQVPAKLIRAYADNRNFPAIEGTSRLGIHFRFGTLSIREKARNASQLSDTYLSELIWRDFYSQILDHFPHVTEGAFKPKYDNIEWRYDAEEFEMWCTGNTGYPIVDAGMRELNTTGHMHNRVRMITSSFLTKHLLMNWQLGEAYFASKLLDFDLASNNGGWQWASGSGTDAAPYFRIFNPHTQLDKFDKERSYVKKFVKEFGTDAYPTFMVDHKIARERCLETYKRGLNPGE